MRQLAWLARPRPRVFHRPSELSGRSRTTIARLRPNRPARRLVMSWSSGPFGSVTPGPSPRRASFRMKLRRGCDTLVCYGGATRRCEVVSASCIRRRLRGSAHPCLSSDRRAHATYRGSDSRLPILQGRVVWQIGNVPANPSLKRGTPLRRHRANLCLGRQARRTRPAWRVPLDHILCYASEDPPSNIAAK